MLAGRVSALIDVYESKSKVNGTRSGTGTGAGAMMICEAETKYATSQTALTRGIYVAAKVEENNAGVGTVTYYLDIPDLGVSLTQSVSGWAASATSRIEFDNLRVYVRDDFTYGVTWTAFRWYGDASLLLTGASGSIAASVGTKLAPIFIPLFGIPARLTASGIAAPERAFGADGQCFANYSKTISGTGEGGWRMKINGSWLTLSTGYSDITPPTPPTPSGGSLSAPTMPGLTTTDTWTNSIDFYSSVSCVDGEPETHFCGDCGECELGSPGEYEITPNLFNETTRNGWITLLPQLAKFVNRYNSDYLAFIRRFALPKAEKRGRSQWNKNYGFDGNPCQNPASAISESYTTTYGTLNSHYDLLDAVVDNSAHVIEDPMDDTVYCPYQKYSYELERRLIDVVQVNPPECIAFPIGCNPASSDPCCFSDEKYEEVRVNISDFPFVTNYDDELAFLRHSNDEAEYCNFWGCVLWSYFLYFPEDNDDDFWKVYNVKRLSGDYWSPIRQQYLEHDNLPSEERYKKRNHVVTEPLSDGALTGIWTNYTGMPGCSPWGISRFEADEATFSDDFVLDSTSEPAWSAENATLTFGSSITVNPSASECTIKFDLGRWNDSAFMLPHIAKSVVVDWSNTNVSGMSVRLENAYGTQTELGTTQDTYDFTSVQDNNYAGSWGQDFGNTILADTGTDVDASGKSAETCSEAELVHAFSLLAGRGAKYLVFVIQVANPAIDVTLEYPEFLMPETSSLLTIETGQTSNLIWEDFQGIRYGQNNWWDGKNLRTEAAIREMSRQMTALDWLAHKRVWFSRQAADDALDTEIATLYDSYEGDDRESAAGHTTSWIYKGGSTVRAGIVNTFREIPPIAWFPFMKTRNATTLEENPAGSYSCESWSVIQGNTRFVSANSELHIEDQSGDPAVRLTESETTLGGWEITKIDDDYEVTNNESGLAIVVGGSLGDPPIANATSWHGYFVVADYEQIDQDEPAIENSGAGRLFRGYIQDGKFIFGVSSNVNPRSWRDRNTLIDADKIFLCCFRKSKESRVYALIQDGSNVYLKFTKTEGRSFISVTTITTSGSSPAMVISGAGLKYIYWVDGTAVKAKFLDAQDNTVRNTFTVAGVTVDTGSEIAVNLLPRARGELTFTLLTVESSQIKSRTSINGVAFS